MVFKHRIVARFFGLMMILLALILICRGSQAEGNSTSIYITLEEEAGISAYANTGQSINLDEAKSIFKSITKETSEFIVGLISSTENVYSLIHKGGWIIVYYPKGELITQLISYKTNHYLEIEWRVDKKLKDKLTEICNTLKIVPSSIKYYHFQYPYANTLKLIADYLQIADHKEYGEKTFELTIPLNLVLDEVSWYHLAGGTYHVKSRFSINKEDIDFIENEGGVIIERRGQLNSEQIGTLPENNKIKITYEPFSGVIIENPLGPSPIQVAFIAIALVYYEEPNSTEITTQNIKYVSSTTLERPPFLPNLPKLSSSAFIMIAPSNFTLMPGESISFTATLIDSSGRPLPGKIISWFISGDPLLSGTLNVDYRPTDRMGRRSFATYTAGEVPCETSVRVVAIFYEGGLEKYAFSLGKILPNPPLIIPLLVFCISLLLTIKLPHKNFRKMLTTIFIFSFSFILSYPLGFSFEFSSLVLAGRVPVWFLAGLIFLGVVVITFSVLERSSKCGFMFGICCWIGITIGLVLPQPEYYMGHEGIEAVLIALVNTSVEGLMFSAFCGGITLLSSRITSIRKPLQLRPIPPSPPSPPPPRPTTIPPQPKITLRQPPSIIPQSPQTLAIIYADRIISIENKYFSYTLKSVLNIYSVTQFNMVLGFNGIDLRKLNLDEKIEDLLKSNIFTIYIQ